MGARLMDALVGLACRILSLPFSLSKRTFPSCPRSMLIIKPCCIGDVLMATPLVAVIRRAYPQARVEFAVGPWSRAMVENNPKIDGAVDCGPVGGGPYSLRDYLSLVRRIRDKDYEACFVLDRSPLIGLLPFFSGIPHRVGLDSGGRGFSLTVRVRVPRKHEVELYLDAARAIGIETEGARLEFYPTEAERGRVEGLLADFDDRRTLLAVHPAGGENPGMRLLAKRWSAERFAILADRLIEDRATVFLLGGPGDKPLTAAVREAMKESAMDLTGQLSWGETGALLERCSLFIGHDTGAMHLAVAVGTPVVAIFGPSDPQMYGPYDGKSVYLWHQVECNPCMIRGRFKAECSHYRCIEAITVDEVYEAARKVLVGK